MWESLKQWLVGDAAKDMSSLRFEFNSPGGTTVGFLTLAIAALGITLFCWPRLAKLPPRTRALLVALRAIVLVLALFMLLDPSLIGKKIEPGKHYVIMLFDDSKSMQIVGEDGLTRSKRMLEAYEASRAEFETKLLEKHRIASYRFGTDIEPIRKIDDLVFKQRESNLTSALGNSLGDLDGVDVSAIIVFSDGIQLPAASSAELEKVALAEVPVFTVGVDQVSQWRDLGMGNIGVKRTEFDKSPVALTLPLYATGLGGEGAIVEIIDGKNKIVKTQRVSIPTDDWEYQMRMDFIPKEKDWLEYQARVRLVQTAERERDTATLDIAVAGKDNVVKNNARRFTIDNRKKEYRILYFAARPNWENKFIRRSLDEDEQLRLTSLVRIADRDREFKFRGIESGSTSSELFKGLDNVEDRPRYDEEIFLRINVDGPELDKGYPISPIDLYPFDLIIWGDIEEGAVNQAQLENTRDYVRKRGGTLLLLGGQNSFTEGNYEGSMLEGMMPVVLEPSRNLAPADWEFGLRKTYAPVPTIEGDLSGVWSLSDDPVANEELWRQLPRLAGLNQFLTVRPGASILAMTSSDDDSIDDKPFFLQQRFGEGKTAVMATSATWQWQMFQELEDDLHERFWRQLVRSLIKDVPRQVYLRDKKDEYTADDEFTLEAVIRDRKFEERESLQVEMKIITPDQKELLLPVEESIDETGVYTASYEPTEEGLYRYSLHARDDEGEIVGSIEDEAFLVTEDEREFQNPQYNPDFLQNIAERTGGEFLTLDRLGEIPDMIPWIETDTSISYRKPLWNLPLLFFLLLALLSVEWYIRRKKGFA